jgi:hypothetical protein
MRYTLDGCFFRKHLPLLTELINIELGVWGIAAQDRPPMTWLFISQTPVRLMLPDILH